MTAPRHIQITLNKDGVAASLQRVTLLASHVVGTSLRALDNDDLSPPEMKAGFVHLGFGNLAMSEDERRQMFRNWILSKGFQDLARGVRETLEEAIFYIELTKLQAGATTWGQLQAHMAAIRSKASRPKFPELLEEVNAGLKERMAFDAEFQSLQNVRNCLEHRGGRVGQKDVDLNTGVMTLNFPRLRLTSVQGEGEIEVYEGQFFEKDTALYFGRATRSRSYALDERIIISASDFFEIAMACQLFASDVAAKLPDLPEKAADLVV